MVIRQIYVRFTVSRTKGKEKISAGDQNGRVIAHSSSWSQHNRWCRDRGGAEVHTTGRLCVQQRLTTAPTRAHDMGTERMQPGPGRAVSRSSLARLVSRHTPWCRDMVEAGLG